MFTINQPVLLVKFPLFFGAGGPLGCLGAIPSQRLGAALRGRPERGKRRGEGGAMVKVDL
jgi:hypothetical protein